MGISEQDAIKELQTRDAVFVVFTGYEASICNL